MLTFDLQLFAEGDPGDPTASPKTYDEEYVKSLRAEAAQHRTKAKELEQSLSQKQAEFQANLLKAMGLDPDPNKNYDKQIADAQAKAQAAEARASELLVKAEIKMLSVELGIIDPEAAYALMDRSKLKITDAGTIEGAKEALQALLTAKPYLKGTAQPPRIGGGSNPPPGSPGAGGNAAAVAMNSLIRRAAGLS